MLNTLFFTIILAVGSVSLNAAADSPAPQSKGLLSFLKESIATLRKIELQDQPLLASISIYTREGTSHLFPHLARVAFFCVKGRRPEPSDVMDLTNLHAWYEELCSEAVSDGMAEIARSSFMFLKLLVQNVDPFLVATILGTKEPSTQEVEEYINRYQPAKKPSFEDATRHAERISKHLRQQALGLTYGPLLPVNVSPTIASEA